MKVGHLLLSEKEIKRQLGIDCDEMRSFIQLYLTYDGVSFPMQAMMFRHTFYPIAKG